MDVNELFRREHTLTMADDVHKRLEEERKRRYSDSIPETIRMILSEYLSSSEEAAR